MSEIVVSGVIGAEPLKQYVDTLAALVDEARIHMNSEGFTCTAVDPAAVAMYTDVSLDSEAFDSLDPSSGAVTVGIDLTRLKEYLKSANGDDLVAFSIDMETRHLEIKYRGIKHDMALIDPDAIRDGPDEMDQDTPNSLTIEADDWDEALSNIDLQSDHLAIRGDPADGDDENDAAVVYAEGDRDLTEITFGGDTDRELLGGSIEDESETMLSLNYLKEVEKPIPNGSEVDIRFGGEIPLFVGYDAVDGAMNVEFWLAPRIDSGY